jgi:hypothetical protein
MVLCRMTEVLAPVYMELTGLAVLYNCTQKNTRCTPIVSKEHTIKYT